jgi:hypothetical protein
LPDVRRELRRLLSVIETLPSAGVVELHGVRSTLFTADPRATRALPYVFGRQAQIQNGAGPRAEGWRVGCIRSDELVRAWSEHWERAAASGPEPVEIRRWDGDPVALRADWPEQIAVVRHRSPFTGLTVFARPLELAAYVLPEAEPLSIHHLEHLLKYTLRVRCWRAGGVEVHAATGVYRDRGIVMMGSRRSGKTTLAMHLLSRGGSLLGSDLALLWDGTGGGPAIRAIPAVCRIASETIADNRYLRAAMARVPPGDDYLEGPVFFDEKYELYPPALDSVFGHPVNASDARADLIVLPRFSVERARQRITPVPPEPARALVRDRLVNDKPLPDWLPFDEVLRRTEIEAGWIDAIVARLPPVVELEFGREDSLDWDELDELVESVG